LVDNLPRVVVFDEDLTLKRPWAVLVFYWLGALAQKANMQPPAGTEWCAGLAATTPISTPTHQKHR
jgi:hypothetical protein